LQNGGVFDQYLLPITLGQLIENLLKKSNAPHMHDPTPSLGLNIERTTISQTLSELVV
jgi:hypothetical protein